MGRSDTNDVVIKDDSTISGTHALLAWRDDGWYISDVGSTNGTFLMNNSKKNRVSDPVRVGQNQTFYLGSSSCHYEASELDVSATETQEMRRDEFSEELRDEPDQESDRVHLPAKQINISLREDELWIRTASIKPISAEYMLPYQGREIDILSSALRDSVLLFNHTHEESSPANDAQIESSLIKLGEWLQNNCFPRPVQTELSKSANSDLLLTLDSSLVHVPWELAMVNGQPMCLQFNMGRQIVLPYRSRLGGLVPEKDKTRLLLVANPDESLPEAQKHGEELYYKIIMNYPQVQVELLAGARANKIDILSRMQSCDIVYYIGHTEYSADDKGQASWLLKNDRLTSQDFENLNNPPSLVFANSCESGREGSWEATESRPISKKGIAGGFIMAGVTNYIGTLWPIPAEGSIVFANSFFDGVLTGTPVGQALRIARMGTADRFGKGNPIWASYVLYGNPSHVHL
jgi:hypothetical protein